MTVMNITVNGKVHNVAQGTTVLELLETFELGTERIAVEHNQVILAKEAYVTVALQEGDTLEVVRFVGGG